jgi:nucleoside-diphosphate-sugar epimerase
MHTDKKVALVIGANGGIGNEVTRALLRRGWLVRALVRRVPTGADALSHPRLEWAVGDAINRQDVIDAAFGATVIVHAVNPAKYHNWRGLALPMIDNTIAAAALNDARILFPGTVYNYGSDAFPLIDERSPQNPATRKGAIRVEMEERLRDAVWEGRARVLIVRAGDFFGPRAGSSWFSQGLVMRGQPVRFVLNPGSKELQHSWAYLPDVAETMSRLLEQEAKLEKFDTFHFRGHWLRNGDMINTICDVAGISRKRVLPFPWLAISASAPFAELSNEMQEMRYLWQEPIKLDNTKLRERIGTEPHTPIEEALRTTLIGIGCMCDSPLSSKRADLTQ